MTEPTPDPAHAGTPATALDPSNAPEGAADAGPPMPRFTVELAAAVVEPGAEVVLTAHVEAGAAQALADATAVFRDADGTEFARSRLTDATGGALRSYPADRRVPDDPGPLTFFVTMEAPDGTLRAVEETVVTVAGHPVAVTHWGVPSALSPGQGFALTVALSCPCGCPAAGWAFVIEDAAGRQVAEGRVGDAPWPGTAGLCHVTLDLAAPEEVGRAVWQIRALAPDHAVPHAPRSQPLHLNVEPAPEVVLRILAVDAATRAPVSGARVVAHPFRTTTDAQGRAELHLPRGRRTVFVSRAPYFAFRSEGELTGDLDLTAELHEDRELSHADAWS